MHIYSFIMITFLCLYTGSQISFYWNSNEKFVFTR